MSLLEHWRNDEILKEAKVKPIAMVMRRRRLEWSGHVKRRDETENFRAVVEIKMEGKRPRGRPKLRSKDTVRRDLKASGRNGPLTGSDGKVSARPATPHRETAAKGENVRYRRKEIELILPCSERIPQSDYICTTVCRTVHLSTQKRPSC